MTLEATDEQALLHIPQTATLHYILKFYSQCFTQEWFSNFLLWSFMCPRTSTIWNTTKKIFISNPSHPHGYFFSASSPKETNLLWLCGEPAISSPDDFWIPWPILIKLDRGASTQSTNCRSQELQRGGKENISSVGKTRTQGNCNVVWEAAH